MRKFVTSLAAGAAVAALAATASQAQQAAPAQPAAPQAAPQAPANISDDKVQSFALAMTQVSSLNQKYTAQLEAAPDESARTEIQRKAAVEMTQAVEGAGISPQEYNQIAQAAQQDAELRARIGQAMQATGQTSAN